jgi:hypothetical protein
MTMPRPNWQPPPAEPRDTAGHVRQVQMSGETTWQREHRHADGRVGTTRVWPGQRRIEDDMSSTAKREFSAEERHQLAAAGKALPDGTYPIEDAADLENAAILARSGHGDVKAARRLIARRANELGVANPLRKPKAQKMMETWTQTGQPAPVPGQQRESPGNHPQPRRSGEIAAGWAVTRHPAAGDAGDPGGRLDVHLWLQPPLTPEPGVTLATVAGAGPLASSIASHQGMVTVQQMNAAAAASPTMMGQFTAPPGGIGGAAREPDHVAPSGHGQPPFVTPKRPGGPASLPAPGSQFSNTVE